MASEPGCSKPVVVTSKLQHLRSDQARVYSQAEAAGVLEHPRPEGFKRSDQPASLPLVRRFSQGLASMQASSSPDTDRLSGAGSAH
jgi:hypothetical protein